MSCVVHCVFLPSAVAIERTGECNEGPSVELNTDTLQLHLSFFYLFLGHKKHISGNSSYKDLLSTCTFTCKLLGYHKMTY